MSTKIRFGEIESLPPAKSGIYEIHTDEGIPLKIGIGKDIRKRLLQHRASKQQRLRLKVRGNRENPNDVESKQSILAKHLYYDRSIATNYDLTTEEGRQAFLLDKCHIVFEITSTRAYAQELELALEHPKNFRYVGRVLIR